MKKIFILTVTALFVVISAANAQNNDAKYKEVLKNYMEVSGSNSSFTLVMDQIIRMMAPNESPEKISEITAKVAPQAMNNLIDLLAPIYAKHLSLNALEESVKFYNTPAGREIAKSSGAIAVESMQVGQQWGMSLQKMINEAIQK